MRLNISYLFFVVFYIIRCNTESFFSPVMKPIWRHHYLNYILFNFYQLQDKSVMPTNIHPLCCLCIGLIWLATKKQSKMQANTYKWKEHHLLQTTCRTTTS